MMFGLYGALLRVIFTGFRGRGFDAIVQGLGMLMAGAVVAVGSIFVIGPFLLLSLYLLILDGILVFALVGSGVVRLVIGIFTLGGSSDDSRSGPAASPVNYYVALPEEMPAGYCWQCGKRVKADKFICLRCGATQPKVAQQRPMISAPTLERGNESGQWPQWQEDESPRGQGPMGPRGSGGFPGAAPYPPGMPYPGGAPYPPPAFPPQNMPNMPYPGPGYPAFPLPSRVPYPGRGPNSRGPYPGGPFRPGQAPAQGKQPRQKKRSRPQAQR